MTLALALLEPLDASQSSASPARQRGAYGIVRDADGRVLVVQAETGRCYLPGGRIEAGEEPAEALVREIIEECGFQAEIGEPIHLAEQRIFAGTVQLQASYWEAWLTHAAGNEPEHRLVWLKPGEAAARLHRTGDRQALALSRR
jgi:8-oxo-dGTP pyrophosphatase MutT (NUDIX family)